MLFAQIERPAAARPGLRQLSADFSAAQAANGFIAFIFAASGPVAIILSVGTKGGLSTAELASWLFGAFFINGLLTVALSWRYREPLCLFWTIPGAVLVGPALGHLSFAEVIGAYYATSLLILLLGLSGLVKKAMQWLPMPIVMGMVAGVFLRFGLDLVRALHGDFTVAGPMAAVFVLLGALPALGRRLPPLIGALIVGAIAILLAGRVDGAALGGLGLAAPVVPVPAWSVGAMVELVLPLAITILVVQNGQGFAVLQAAGHKPPVNLVTLTCGIGGALSALVGAVGTCLTGPTNALIVSAGPARGHYTGAMTTGLLAIGFGLFAPTFTGLLLAAPREYIMALGGLAMLRVLQNAFAAAFRDRFTLGALVSFLVTVADLPLFNIGAAFWGLIAGYLLSRILERGDFSAS